MRNIYNIHGQRQYNRMYQFELRKTKDGIVYDIYDPETGEHYIPFRKSKKTGKAYKLIRKTASYITTEFYKGNIELVMNTDYPNE